MKDTKKQQKEKNSSFAYTEKKRNQMGKIIQKTEQENTLIIYYSHLARISASLKMKYSLSLISTLVPPYSGNNTLSPAWTLTGT